MGPLSLGNSFFGEGKRSQQGEWGGGNIFQSRESLEETNTSYFAMKMLLTFQEFRLISLQLIRVKNIFLEVQKEPYLL